MQLGSDGAPLMLKSELLYHPELRGWSLKLKSERLYITLSSKDGTLDSWGPGFTKHELLNQPELGEQSLDVAPVMLQTELLYHAELTERSLGVMGRP